LVQAAHGINLAEQIEGTYHAIILAVAHDCFNTINFKAFKQQGAIIYDTKSMIDVDLVDARL
jgi:UDP-N-acetyl-D-galactosamine dehydrogenase